MSQVIDIGDLLQLSEDKKQKQANLLSKASKALVFWIDEALTSIVDAEDVINPEDFKVGSVTNIKWRVRGRKEIEIYKGKILDIGDLAQMRVKEDEVNLQIEDHQNKKNAKENQTKKKRGRKTPAILADFVLQDDVQSSGTDIDAKKAALLKKKEEATIRVEAFKRTADELFALPPLYALNTECVPVVASTAHLSDITSDVNNTIQNTGSTATEHNDDLMIEIPECQQMLPFFRNEGSENSSALAIREAIETVNECNVSACTPVVQFPDSQLLLPANNDTHEINVSQQSVNTIEHLKKQLEEKNNLIEEQKAIIEQYSQRGACTRCKILDQFDTKASELFLALYKCMGGDKSGNTYCDATTSDANASHQPRTRSSSNMVELHPGTGIWVSSQQKSMCILKGHGKPAKLVAKTLQMFYSNSQLASFSMCGQRNNPPFPEKEADAIKEFVLSICKKSDGKPAATNKQLNRYFNRAFGVARDAEKKENKES